MEKVYTHLQMDLAILENGKTICSMDKVKKLGKIILTSLENMLMDYSMVKELTFMQMAQYMKVIGKIIKFMELAPIHGKMERFIQDNGKKEICMDKVYLAGPMAEDTKVNIY